MNIRAKFHSVIAGALCVASLGSAGVAEAQLLGGGGNVGGSFGGALSGAPRSMGGSLQGGLNGSTQFNSGAMNTRTVRDRVENRAKSGADVAAHKTGDAVDSSRRTASNAEHRTERSAAGVANAANNAATVSSDAAGGAAANAQSKSADVSAAGSALGSSEVNRNGVTTNPSADLFGSARRTKSNTQPSAAPEAKPAEHRPLTPQVDATGDASANANASRSKSGAPKARASADADGNVSASRR